MLIGFIHCFVMIYFLDLVLYVPDTEHRCGNAEECDDDVQHYCQQALTGPRAGVWGIGVAGRCLSKTLAQGQYMAQGCKTLVVAAAPKVRCHVSRMAIVLAISFVLLSPICNSMLLCCSCTMCNVCVRRMKAATDFGACYAGSSGTLHIRYEQDSCGR